MVWVAIISFIVQTKQVKGGAINNYEGIILVKQDCPKELRHVVMNTPFGSRSPDAGPSTFSSSNFYDRVFESKNLFYFSNKYRLSSNILLLFYNWINLKRLYFKSLSADSFWMILTCRPSDRHVIHTFRYGNVVKVITQSGCVAEHTAKSSVVLGSRDGRCLAVAISRTLRPTIKNRFTLVLTSPLVICSFRIQTDHWLADCARGIHNQSPMDFDREWSEVCQCFPVILSSSSFIHLFFDYSWHTMYYSQSYNICIPYRVNPLIGLVPSCS